MKGPQKKKISCIEDLPNHNALRDALLGKGITMNWRVDQPKRPSTKTNLADIFHADPKKPNNQNE